MKTEIGIFRSWRAAEKALQELQANGFSQDQYLLLTSQTQSAEPLTDKELTPDPPGACGANSGQVAGAITGFASGILGGALVGLVVPGLGPLLAIGALAFGGSFGAVVGGVVGNNVQESVDSVASPEELFIYEYALRQGCQVLVIQPTDDVRAGMARRILAEHGAEDANQARHQWWQQLRQNEANAYVNGAEPFSQIEARYRQGFEAAMDARLRGKTFEEKETLLTQYHGAIVHDDAFRQGLKRGDAYYTALVEKGDPRRSTDFAAIEEAPSQS